MIEQKWAKSTLMLKLIGDKNILKPNEYLELIHLLKRGEKYEAMFKEIKEKVLNMEYCENVEIEKLEQRYFLKGEE